MIVGGAVGAREPEFVAMMASRGIEVRPTAVVDVPQTLVAMVRAGVGVGVANAVAIDSADTADLVALSLDDAEMIREVAVYWYDALLSTEYGQALQQAVLQAPLPKGAIAVGRSDWQPGW